MSGEGTHFLVPIIQKPIIFDCKARPRNIPVVTGSKGTFLLLTQQNFGLIVTKQSISDLQNVNITLRILFRPKPSMLPSIFSNIGEDYDERILPSITNEVLKAVVVSCFLDILLEYQLLLLALLTPKVLFSILYLFVLLLF